VRVKFSESSEGRDFECSGYFVPKGTGYIEKGNKRLGEN